MTATYITAAAVGLLCIVNCERTCNKKCFQLILITHSKQYDALVLIGTSKRLKLIHFCIVLCWLHGKKAESLIAYYNSHNDLIL